MKTHLRRIVGDVKLTFEELSTVLSQIEACLNSCSLASLSGSEDGIKSLTPGHFLIGRPLKSFPDPASSYQSLSVLQRWYRCQSLVRHFWKRWSGEYLIRLSKWHHSPKNLTIGDIVALQEDNMIAMKWPLARITQTQGWSHESSLSKRPLVSIHNLLQNLFLYYLVNCVWIGFLVFPPLFSFKTIWSWPAVCLNSTNIIC